MFLLAFIDKLFLVYTVMLLVRILGTWIPEWRESRFMLFLAYYTDPFLNLFRRIIPPLGMLDLSPMIAILCLGMLKVLVLGLVSMLLGYT